MNTDTSEAFGPLNGPRTALVIAAALAALVAGALGHWTVTAVLLSAVALHGLGWLYLYRTRDVDGRTD